MDIQTLIMSTIWFGLPAGAANMAPVFTAKLFPAWDYPLDGNLRLFGKRLLGDHKTVRGLIAGVIFGGATFLWQQSITGNPMITSWAWIDYAATPWYLGCFFGLGAIIGDAAKSVIKRQVNIPPGKPWFPFDQADWIIGMLLFISPWVRLTIAQIGSLTLLGVSLHILSKIIGKFLRLNQTYI